MDLATADLANGVRLIVFAIPLLVVPISVVVALFVRRRYVAAVVRLQGRSEFQSVESERTLSTDRPLTIIEEPLAVPRSRNRPSSVLRLRRRVLATQMAGDLLLWTGCCAVSLAPVLASMLVTTLRNHDAETLGVMLRVARAFTTVDTTTPSPVWINLLFVVLWLVMPAALVTAAQTAARRWHAYVPIAIAAVVWIAETIRVAWWSIETVAVVATLAAAGALVAFLHDPRVRGAASPTIIGLGTSMFVWAVLGIAIDLPFEDVKDPDVGFSTTDVVAMAAYAVAVAATIPGVLHVLGWAYRRKRVSDIQLARMAFWMLTVLAAFGAGALEGRLAGGLMDLVSEIGVLTTWILLLAIIQGSVRRRLVRAAPPQADALLILRIFKRPSRSEAFVDRLMSFWRFAGPVHFIAGPDLAGAAIEPDEFFGFLRGRLADRFVRVPGEVGARIDGLDSARDPDGRFRVNELFCTDSTWRAAVDALMMQASVVLLDLREYDARRGGIRYEIGQLMNVVSLERIVVLVGKKDDMHAIRAELTAAWQSLSDAALNRRISRPELRVCRLQSGSAAEVKALFLRAYALATHPDQPAGAAAV